MDRVSVLQEQKEIAKPVCCVEGATRRPLWLELNEGRDEG